MTACTHCYRGQSCACKSLNAHIGKSRPAAHQGELPELEADAVGEMWAAIVVAAVCVLALAAAFAPILI